MHNNARYHFWTTQGPHQNPETAPPRVWIPVSLVFGSRPGMTEEFREKAPGARKAAAGVHSEAMAGTIDYQTDPSRYRHWRIERDGDIAYLIMDVDQTGGLGDYELKLNSYDLGVDIELSDAVQRLRFEHPEVRCVVIKSGKDNVFCAGANIRMLGKATHGAKVNFCKFTNETRLAI